MAAADPTRFSRHLLRAGGGCVLLLIAFVVGVVLSVKYGYERNRFGQCVAVSPASPWVVTGHHDGLVLWHPGGAGVPPRPLPLFPAMREAGSSRVVTFSPDGRLVASGGWDGTIRVHELETGQCVAVHSKVHGNWVAGLAFDEDGAWSSGADGRLIRWDATFANQLEAFPLGRTFSSIAPRGSALLLGGDDGVLHRHPAPAAARPGVLSGHRAGIWHVEWLSASRAMTFSWDGTARVWDLERGVTLAELKAFNAYPMSAPAVSPDGRRVASASIAQRLLKVWDLEKLVECDARPLELGDAYPWYAAGAFTADRTALLALASDGTLRRLDLETPLFDVAPVSTLR